MKTADDLFPPPVSLTKPEKMKIAGSVFVGEIRGFIFVDPPSRKAAISHALCVVFDAKKPETLLF